jgi:hypothetical protein
MGTRFKAGWRGSMVLSYVHATEKDAKISVPARSLNEVKLKISITRTRKDLWAQLK